MSYLDDLDHELQAAGIPRRRRARILTEFADHLAERPDADLGEPTALARQFADQLGTRMARATAYRAFVALAMAGSFLAVMFVTGGRQHGWVGNGSYDGGLAAAWWWVPLQAVCVVTGQVALASGLLALLRAFKLRGAATMTAADARMLNRRAALGLVAGAITMTVLPLTYYATSLAYSSYGWWWPATRYGGIAAIVLLLALLPDVLRAARLRPTADGPAGDLTADIGIHDPRITPNRIAVALSVAIFVALTLVGVRSADPIDGLLRGLTDAAACLIGYATLGRYLGIRSSTN